MVIRYLFDSWKWNEFTRNVKIVFDCKYDCVKRSGRGKHLFKYSNFWMTTFYYQCPFWSIFFNDKLNVNVQIKLFHQNKHYIFSFIYSRMTQGTILFQCNVLFVCPMMAGITCPYWVQIHQRSSSNDAYGKFCLTGWTSIHPKMKYGGYRYFLV